MSDGYAKCVPCGIQYFYRYLSNHQFGLFNLILTAKYPTPSTEYKVFK